MELAVGSVYCDWTLGKLSGHPYVRLPYHYLGASFSLILIVGNHSNLEIVIIEAFALSGLR